MSFRKFWIVLGFSFGFLAGWWVVGLATDVEEPLAPTAILDGYDIGSEEGAAPASATAVGVNYLRPPVPGRDDVFETTVGPNQIVSAPQSISPAGLIGRSEMSIAVDGDDGLPGENIVIGWNDADGFLPQFALAGLSGWAFSSNSGASFVDGGGLPTTTIPTSPPTIISTSGDPWLALLRDNLGNGTFLYANLGVRANVPGNGPGNGRSVAGLTVHRGTVSGGALSWATPSLIPSPSAVGTFGLDKEAITVNPNGNVQEVYVTATNFDVGGSSIGGIVAFSSLDGGATFSGATLVQGVGADGVQGSMPAVGTNGDVYVVWERGRFNFPNPAKIQFARSTNKGATFGTQVDVASIIPAAQKPPAGYNRSRYNDFPRIAVAHTGPYKGRIYVAYHDAGSNPDLPGTVLLDPNPPGGPLFPSAVADADAFIKYSDDGGNTWSAPVNVNGAIGDGKVQFWPVVSTTDGGVVSVVYQEDVEANLTPDPNNFETVRGIDGGTRFSTRSTLVDTYVAISIDGGASFGAPVRITNFTSNWSRTVSNIRPNYGDYIDATSREIGPNTVRVYATWHDGRDQVDINPNPDITDLRPVPSGAYGSVDITIIEGAPKVVASVPKNFVLGQNFPNPFNPSTQIDYALPEAVPVELKVYNLLGQEVKTLVNHEQAAGDHRVVWDGTDASGNGVSSGIYFYKLTTPASVATKRMMFVK
ncbi:MAG: T9SS type A sorting domain-containing protein [candidate division Zixibacteria bacterium]|nr:T9SS type A sorting domain-containing protein [candidate division Zixibacteria bacterium]